jgi:hypothetical protein
MPDPINAMKNPVNFEGNLSFMKKLYQLYYLKSSYI